MKFRVEHVFKGITLKDYEALYFDEAFQIAQCQAVKLHRTLVKREVTDGRLVRAVKVGPDREIPAPVAKVLGANRIEYTEHVDYVLGSNKGTWKTVSSLLTDKVDASGTFSFRETPAGIARVVEGEVSVRIFGIGGIVEKFVGADIERSYGDAAKFMQQWIDDGKAVKSA